jgi:peptide deformylase
MSIEVVELGHPTLRKKALPIDDIFSNETETLIENLIQALKKHKGIGIAAPQIGVDKQLFIVAPYQEVSAPYTNLDSGLIVINPTITLNTKQVTYEWEGCLSIPGLRGRIPRQCDITIEYTNKFGEIVHGHYKDFTARIFLHEYDHLIGRMFVDLIENPRTDLMTDAVYVQLMEAADAEEEDEEGAEEVL